MKHILLATLLLLPALAFEYTWTRDWQDRCLDEDIQDFVIYWNSSQYRTGTGLILLNVEPKVDGAKYVSNLSFAVFADSETPLIPGLDYPTTGFGAGVNYTFFIPIEFSTNLLDMRIVANSTTGAPRCKDVSWETSNRFRVEDFEMPLETEAEFNPETHKFDFSINNLPEGVYVFATVLKGNRVEEVSFIESNLEKESKKTYNSKAVADGEYSVEFFAANDTATYYDKVSLFEFYDFDLELGTTQEFVPGESYTSTITLRNNGYWEDNYEINFTIPLGWNVEISKPGQLSRGEEKQLSVYYTVDKFQVGPETITITITSKSSGLTKEYEMKLSPKEYTSTLIQIQGSTNLTAYDANNISLQIAASGTVNPKLFYVVYTEPSLLISQGTGIINAKSGDFTNTNVQFSIGTSCAMQQEDSMGFISGRKLLVLEKLAYDITSDPSNKSLEKLAQINSLVDVEKLRMTSQASSRLFSEAERFQSWIVKFTESVSEDQSVEYLAGLREDLYLNIVDLNANLFEVGTRMSEDCYSVDSVVLHIFTLEENTLSAKDVTITTGITGPKFFEFLGPSEIKAIAGDSVEYKYILKNNAPEDFVIDIAPSDDVIQTLESVYLRSGSRKELTVKIRPPEFLEDEFDAYIELKSRTYSIKFPITLSIGPFEPELSAKDIYAIMPGKDSQINITLSTGGLDDLFHITVEGPSWISGPTQIQTKDGYASIPLYISNPDSNDGLSNVEITIVSDSFNEFRDSVDFDIKVDTETPYLLQRVDSYRETLEQKKADKTISSENYLLVKNMLDDAERYLEEGKVSSAKIKLNRAESYLAKDEKVGGFNYNILIAAGVLLGSGFLFWKFLLPKLKGTGSASGQQAYSEEVI